MNNRKFFKPLYGVNGGPGAFWPKVKGPSQGFVSVSQQYQEIGVRSIRFHDFCGAGDMMNYFPIEDANNLPDPNDPKSYYWAETDKQLAKIRKGGFEVHVRISQSWRNMAAWAPFEGMKVASYQLNPDNTANFWPNIHKISAVVSPDIFLHFLERVLKKGKFDQQAELYVDFWNEPNIMSINTVHPPETVLTNEEYLNTPQRNYEWDGTPLEFYQLFEKGAKAIRKQYCQVKIGGPSLWNPGADETLYPDNKRWLDGFFQHVKENHVPMDFIGWNVYSDDPEQFKKVYGIIQGYLDDIGYTHTQQVITEYAIAFSNTTKLPNSVTIPNSLLAKGAAIATSLWITLQGFDNLHDAFYYRGNDGPFVPNGVGYPYQLELKDGKVTNPNSNNFGQTGVGIFHGDGTKKPVARAYKMWSQMADLTKVDPANYITADVPSEGNVYLLAGEKKNGDVIILASYVNEISTLNASFSLSKKAVKGAASLTMKTILDDRVERSEVTDPKQFYVLPNFAFQIKISPKKQKK